MSALFLLVFSMALATEGPVGEGGGAESDPGEVSTYVLPPGSWPLASDFYEIDRFGEHDACVKRSGLLRSPKPSRARAEINMLRYDLCMRERSLLRREPLSRTASFSVRWRRVASLVESSSPSQMRRLAPQLADLRGRAWELDQLVNRSVNQPCDEPPGDLVIMIRAGGGLVKIPYKVHVDTAMCVK